MLKRHQCCIDLRRNRLVIGTTGDEARTSPLSLSPPQETPAPDPPLCSLPSPQVQVRLRS